MTDYDIFADEDFKVIFLHVPFADRQVAKELGAHWNADKKQWYCISSNENLEVLLKLFGNPAPQKEAKLLLPEEERLYLKVHYGDKSTAKKLKRIWDSTKKQWYCDKSNPNSKKIIELFGISNNKNNNNALWNGKPWDDLTAEEQDHYISIGDGPIARMCK